MMEKNMFQLILPIFTDRQSSNFNNFDFMIIMIIRSVSLSVGNPDLAPCKMCRPEDFLEELLEGGA